MTSPVSSRSSPSRESMNWTCTGREGGSGGSGGSRGSGEVRRDQKKLRSDSSQTESWKQSERVKENNSGSGSSPGSLSGPAPSLTSTLGGAQTSTHLLADVLHHELQLTGVLTLTVEQVPPQSCSQHSVIRQDALKGHKVSSCSAPPSPPSSPHRIQTELRRTSPSWPSWPLFYEQHPPEQVRQAQKLQSAPRSPPGDQRRATARGLLTQELLGASSRTSCRPGPADRSTEP